MPDSLRQESPLNDFLTAVAKASAAQPAGVQLEELAFYGHINLRGNPADAAFLDGVQRCLGISLPLEPNTAAEDDTTAALWLAPDEWLLITEPGSEGECVRALREALQNQHIAVTEITDGQTILRLSGPHAIDVLRKGCGIDLHARSFRAGQCAQTHLEKVGVLIHKIDDSPVFHLIVRRSFSDFLAIWLQDAAAEYGLAVVTTQAGA